MKINESAIEAIMTNKNIPISERLEIVAKLNEDAGKTDNGIITTKRVKEQLAENNRVKPQRPLTFEELKQLPDMKKEDKTKRTRNTPFLEACKKIYAYLVDKTYKTRLTDIYSSRRWSKYFSATGHNKYQLAQFLKHKAETEHKIRVVMEPDNSGGKKTYKYIVYPAKAKVAYEEGLGTEKVFDEGKEQETPTPHKDYPYMRRKKKVFNTASRPSMNNPNKSVCRTFRSQYMSMKTKEYMRFGDGYIAAAHKANADYANYVKAHPNYKKELEQGKPICGDYKQLVAAVPDMSKAAIVEFPAMKHLTATGVEILKDILRHIDRKGGRMSYASDGFALGFYGSDGRDPWQDTMVEIIAHEEQIKASLNLSKDKHYKISYGNLIFR